jgi:hypothetical protein
VLRFTRPIFITRVPARSQPSTVVPELTRNNRRETHSLDQPAIEYLGLASEKRWLLVEEGPSPADDIDPGETLNSPPNQKLRSEGLEELSL